MAKKQTFLDKTKKKEDGTHCPVCDIEYQYIKQVKAVKSDTGSWKYRTINTGVCKCNEKDIYI